MKRDIANSTVNLLGLVLAVAGGCGGCTPSETGSGHPDPIDVRFSHLGAEYEVPMSGGEEWTLPLDLPPSSFAKFVIEPTGIRVGLRLTGPAGEETTIGKSRPDEPTPVLVVSRFGGKYALILRCREDEDPHAECRRLRISR